MYKKEMISKFSPQQNLVLGFTLYTILGVFFLSIPFCQNVSISILDNAFIAVSAISTTGLVTISIFDSYNIWGQIIILTLIQIGGIGYMTFSSFILLSSQKNLSSQRVNLLNAEFSLPQGFKITEFVKSVILFTISIEILGAVAFVIALSKYNLPISFIIWSSIFHSISSFCTAGFGLYNDSFEQFKLDVSLNAIISVLSILGSLGFIVLSDIWYKFTKKDYEVTFTSKVIISVIFLLSFSGTILIFFNETSIQTFSVAERLLISFFQTMSALTTVGFNSVPIGLFSIPTLLGITFLMYVGASPSGTGGGLKSTTLTSLIAVIFSRLKGSNRVHFLGRQIPIERIYVATSTFIFYTFIIFTGSFLLSFTENFSFHQLLFEVCSAIGTVGLSTGITGVLSSFGKIVIIGLMFLGRVGVLTFGVAIFAKKANPNNHSKLEDLAV